MTTPRPEDCEKREKFFADVVAEIERAYQKHGRAPWGRHEFYAILLEEVDEVWDEIKADGPDKKLHKEIIQVAAMCLRYLETGDRYRVLLKPTPSKRRKERKK